MLTMMETCRHLMSLAFIFVYFVVETSGCADSDVNCPALVAGGGDCVWTTLGSTCKLSCNNCHIPDCGDYHDNCASWAAAGECSANPGYMLVSCMISCGLCPTTAVQTTTSLPTTEIAIESTTTSQEKTTTRFKITETSSMTTTTPRPSSTPATMVAEASENSTDNCEVCTCGTYVPFTFNISDEATLEAHVRSAMEDITAKLKVNTTSLSSSIRTRMCAKDDRPSSATIGWIGTVVMGVVFGSLVLPDAVTFVSCIFARLSHLMK